MERQGKCKKKFKFSSVTSHCEPLFSNQTTMLDSLDLQSLGKKMQLLTIFVGRMVKWERINSQWSTSSGRCR
jgi:hypothetical protein